MERDIYKVASLLKKSLVEDITPQEQDELDNLLQDPHIAKVYAEMQDRRVIGREFGKYAAFSPKEGYTRFVAALRKRRRTVLLRIGAAAAVVLVGFLSYLSMKPEIADPGVSAETETIIPAGSTKALLTLGDGTSVEVQPDLSIAEKGIDIRTENGKLAYSFTTPIEEPVYHELSIPLGGEFYFVLSDGSQVWLNAGTHLKYPVNFTGKEREVFLNGEAYFDIKNDSRRFIVRTDFGSVEVLGTEFGVTGYGNDGKCFTTLVKGSVVFSALDGHRIELLPGEQAVASGSGELTKVRVDPEEFIGWKNGLYVFRGKRFGEIMETFERWYDITVEYEDDRLKDIIYTGNVKRYDNINLFLAAVRSTGDLNYKIEGSKVILTR